MKKTISILLALLLLSSIAAGCGSKEELPEAEPVPVLTEKAPVAAETQASASETTEATASPIQDESFLLGKWIGYYIEDIEGLRVPMGKDQGMCLDLLLEEDGKATIYYYLGENAEPVVEATWSGNADELTVVSQSEEMPGTFHCKYIDGILYIKAFPAIGSFLKMGLPGTHEAEMLQAGADAAAERLEQIKKGTAGAHSH